MVPWAGLACELHGGQSWTYISTGANVPERERVCRGIGLGIRTHAHLAEDASEAPCPQCPRRAGVGYLLKPVMQAADTHSACAGDAHHGAEAGHAWCRFARHACEASICPVAWQCSMGLQGGCSSCSCICSSCACRCSCYSHARVAVPATEVWRRYGGRPPLCMNAAAVDSCCAADVFGPHVCTALLPSA